MSVAAGDIALMLTQAEFSHKYCMLVSEEVELPSHKMEEPVSTMELTDSPPIS
jgi:hypothetical protein